MSIWMRILNMAGIILLHLALIPLLFPSVSVPIVLVVVSVLWTALLGFPSVLPPLLTVIIICDSILFGSVQFSSLYFIGVSYSVSFFMKRTLLGEQSGLGFFVLALFAGIATVGYFFFDWILNKGAVESLTPSNIFPDFLLALLLFAVLLPVLRWFESVIRTLRQEARFSVK